MFLACLQLWLSVGCACVLSVGDESAGRVLFRVCKEESSNVSISELFHRISGICSPSDVNCFLQPRHEM